MSAVVVFMPQRPPSDDADGSHVQGRPQNGHKRVSTLLVVEDEILVRTVVADHLRDAGYRIIEAANAEEARQVLRVEPIELVVSDVNLPGMDGISLAAWIAKEFPDVRVVLASGDPRNASVAKTVATFLLKPFELSTLEGLIRSMI